MSESSERGKAFENAIAKLLRTRLGVKVTRDPSSGSKTNKFDISDWYNSVPLKFEAKNQKTLKIPDWWRQIAGNVAPGQAPALVFNADGEILSCLRFTDLLDFLVEIRDQKAELEDIRRPKYAHEIAMDLIEEAGLTPTPSDWLICGNGHLCDEFGSCQQKGCPFSHGYKSTKAKGKKK